MTKQIRKIFFILFIIELVFLNFIISFGENIELPEYLYYTTISDKDLYMDVYKNIVIFDNGEKKQLVKYNSFGVYKWDLKYLQEYVKKKVVDNEGNLYYEIETYINNNQGYGLVKIDKNLNVEEFELTHSNAYNLFNGVLYYSTYENGKGMIIKYENGQKTTLFEKERHILNLLKLTEKSFIISYYENPEFKCLLYNDGIVSDYDISLEEYNKILSESGQKSNYVKLDYKEKIENYHGVDLNKAYAIENDKEDDEKIEDNEYLYIDDDGSISYFFYGEKVENTLVFLDGNIRTNKGPMCLADTYAYYFGSGGKAMKSGRVAPKIPFQTDGAYRILKKYKNVYDVLLNKNKYEIYDDYFLMGKYEQDDVSANGAEDIKWIILEDDGENLLLLSKYVMDYEKIDSNFMNDIFYNKSFTDDEKKKIVSKSGMDKIFLISENTLDKHSVNYKNKYKFREESLISAIPTNHTVVKGIDVSLNDNELYYHSPYLINDDKIANADETISIKINSEEKFGFRPAMWIKKE